MEETYILQVSNELFCPSMPYNQRGFTYDELISYVHSNSLTEYNIISIDEEIEKYDLHGNEQHKSLMDTKCYNYDIWRNAYRDNNINGFSLPIIVNNNLEYCSELQSVFERYCSEVSKPAFIYENGLVDDIKQNCDEVIRILQLLIDGDYNSATDKLRCFVERYIDNSFVVNELDKSYSFRGVAPFMELHDDGNYDIYQIMNDTSLSFYRVRTKEKTDKKTKIIGYEDIVHLSYAKRDSASNMRFSCAGSPCLYLGTTSYVCSKECGWDSTSEDLFASAFLPNEDGKKLKILNLTVSQALINGIYARGRDDFETVRRSLQCSMLKIFPLVIATSFRVADKNREIKYEYLISQALMKIVSGMGIDGIAYLSMQGKNEFQYPHGVNLALPAFDISEEKPYSKYCEMFNITLPARFEEQDDMKNKSYINAVYPKYDKMGQEHFLSKVDIDGTTEFYGETQFGKFDNWLIGRKKGGFYPQKHKEI